ncbi:hypothetical protein RJZ56_007744 [Blastomyces dermatitidis]
MQAPREGPDGRHAAQSSSINLSNVIQVHPNDRMRVEASVISIPGYHTPPVSKWGVDDELYRAAIAVDSVSRLHIYIYRPAYASPDHFSWENFLRAGSDLAEHLAQLSTEFPQRPIIFIAHSLGGVLLKKALFLVHQNLQDPRFKLVVGCLSGILFLGTPHGGVTDEDTLLRHNRILHKCAKIATHKRKLPTSDIFQLANLAVRFEQISSIPLLSVFECGHRLSCMQRLLGTKQALVDEQTATISSSMERLFGVHLSHKELCKLSLLTDQNYSARDFLRTLFEDVTTNEKWAVRCVKSGQQMVSQSPVTSNPLNPPNLADIELLGITRKLTFTSEKGSHVYKGSGKSTHQIPRRLLLLSPNSERLLSGRKCRLPCFSLAGYPPNRDFVGRKDILDLMDKHLLPREMPDSGNVHSTRLFAICGMGGVGKTDIAIQYSYSRKEKFGAIFWLEAGGVSQLVSDFGRIPTQLGLEGPDEAQDLENSKEIAKAWLNKANRNENQEGGAEENSFWLLIFDNADNLDIIADYLPYDGNGSVLITSRDPFAKTHFRSDGSGIDLDPLSTVEAATLLRKLAKGSTEIEDEDELVASTEVATQFGGLPLAMTQMAGFIRKRHLSIREYVNLFASDAQYVETRNVSNAEQEYRYGYTLATTYNFRDLKRHAKKLLQSLAFMNPDRIREDIYIDPQRSRDQGSGLWVASTFESARYELLSSSIIKRNVSRKELWIHPVIQAEVRTGMDAQQCYQTFKEDLYLLSEIWPPGDLCRQARERWALCEDLFPHLERLYQIYIEYSQAWARFPVDPAFPILLNEAAVYLHERGFSHEGKAYLTLALDLCGRDNILQEPLVSDMHLTMGALSNETNDAQSCLEHNIICLTRRKAEAGKNNKPDLRFAFAHSQLGIAYMMIGKFALATEYFKQCIEMIKGLDVDVDEFGFPVCNLGLAYWVQGELDAADETLTDLLMQREKRHGKLDRVSYKTGRVLQALGNVKNSKAARLAADGNHESAKRLWDEAFNIHSECLKQYESTLGKFNHRTADACHKLAEHHIRYKQHDLAQ